MEEGREGWGRERVRKECRHGRSEGRWEGATERGRGGREIGREGNFKGDPV